jgi:3',5'-cyclic AMP phosphodiesterase CpdA
MLVAHLSDPHITTGPLGSVPAHGLSLALGRVLALDPRPDCVVITGDLTDHGRADEYAILREVVERFPLPLHLVTGNHDRREPLLETFGGTPLLAGGHSARYVVEYPQLTLVVLDSLVPGTDAGRLGEEQLDWLDSALAARPGVPAMVALHHPPVPVGIPFMDGIRLADGPALARVIGGHRHVVRVLAGHLHRTTTTGFAGTVLTVAPSTYRQVDLAMRGGIGYRHEPTGFLLHLSTDTDWITHSVPVSHTAAVTHGF